MANQSWFVLCQFILITTDTAFIIFDFIINFPFSHKGLSCRYMYQFFWIAPSKQIVLQYKVHNFLLNKQYFVA